MKGLLLKQYHLKQCIKRALSTNNLIEYSNLVRLQAKICKIGFMDGLSSINILLYHFLIKTTII